MRIALVIILLTGVCAACGQGKDSLYLNNGQILIGDIKGIDLGILTIDDVDLKLVKIKLYKIRRLQSAHVFKIETNSRKGYYGRLISDSVAGKVVIVSASERVSVWLTEINELIPLDRSVLGRLDGNLTVGFSYSKSSGIGQVNLSSSVLYLARRFEHQLTATGLYSIDSAGLSRDREDVALFSTYSFTPTWFAAGAVNYQRNLELSISRRFQEMIGGGNKIVLQKELQLLLITGLTFTQEVSTEGVSRGLLLEWPVMFRFNFFRFRHPNIQISTSQTFYTGITEAGRFRFDGSTGFSWELVTNFSLSLNFYNNYDSRPPGNSKGNADFGTVVGITYKF